jgi:hypothetical protein
MIFPYLHRSLFLMAACALALAASAAAQFETRASFFLGPVSPYSLVVGDFNRDGMADLAVITTYRSGGVRILLGNGDGTFQAAAPYPTTAESYMVGLGNFTGGKQIDIITIEGTSTEGVECDCVEVLPGNGDGTFGSPITTPVPYNITGFAVAPGEFDDDGELDAAVSGEFGTAEQVDILLGNGNGTFTPDSYYAVSATPQSIATGYFTEDRKHLDLAAANSLGESVSVLLGNGDGTFQPAVFYGAASPATWVIAQDMNGDGKVDLVASNSGLAGQLQESPPGVTVFNGNGDGTFRPGAFYPAGSEYDGNYLAAGDFNEDHRPDLVTVDLDGGTVVTLLNTGVVSFSPTTPLNFKNQAVGTTSPPQSVTLTNTGTTELKIQSMKASSEFEMSSTCGKAVTAGANCTISATFSPAKKGSVQGTITIIDSASTKPQVIELLGTGT